MITLTFNGKTYKCPFVGAHPPLSAVEGSYLRADISARGVVTPVVVSEDDEIIDGYGRLMTAICLRQSDVPIVVVTGLTAAQKEEMAMDLNMHRRHLTRQQKREIVVRKLKAEPSRSNYAIAREADVSDQTVSYIRRKLEAASEIPVVRACDRNGRACSLNWA
jgi:ParB-like chromosome segregation protein Spo0J